VKLTTLIRELQAIEGRHGDLECIDTEGNDDFTMEVQGSELIVCDRA
jgi:hypothetical protein